MKTIYLFLLANLILLSCNSNKENNSSEVFKQAIQSELTGKWRIKTYHLAPHTAMDDSKAKEWLDQVITIDTKVHFNYENIVSYRESFKNEGDCDILYPTTPVTIKAEQFFEPGIVTDLKIGGTNIQVFKTDCRDNPLSSLTFTENKELIIYWDGTYFRSIKE